MSRGERNLGLMKRSRTPNDEDDDAGREEAVRAKATPTTARELWAVVQDDLLKLNPSLTPERIGTNKLGQQRVEFSEDGLSLKKLDLSGLGLTALPESIGRLRVKGWPCEFSGGLQGGDVNLQFNRLTSLPESLGDLVVEGGLRLNNNLLETLPDSFCKGIKVGGQLQLMNNKIASVPESFAAIRARSLSVQSNPICELRAGKRVKIAGIQSRSELNGQYAECITHDVMKRRWIVKIEGSDEQVSLEELNLSAGCPKIFPNVRGIVIKGDGASHFLGFQGEGTSGMLGSRGNTFGQPFQTPVPDL